MQGQPDLARPARRAVRVDRQGRSHRPSAIGRFSADRLQDRRRCRPKKEIRSGVRAAIAAGSGDPARRQLWRRSTGPRRRSNIGSSAAVARPASARPIDDGDPGVLDRTGARHVAGIDHAASTIPRHPIWRCRCRRAGRALPITSISNGWGAARSRSERRRPHPHGVAGRRSRRVGLGRGLGRHRQDHGADRPSAAADARRHRSGAHAVPDLYPRRRRRDGEPARRRARRMGDIARRGAGANPVRV